MANRIFVAVVFLLWAGTTSWLMVARILPPFFYGEPPRRGMSIDDKPICWQIECNGRQMGYAVTQAVPGALESTEIHSRVLLERFRLREVAPQWMSGLSDTLGTIRLDVRNAVVLDSLGNFASFTTKVQLNDLPLAIKMNGRVEDAELVLQLYTEGVNHEARYPMPRDALLAGDLIPQAELLPLYVGRKWQHELFSPFRAPGDSLEILQAEVVEEGQLEHRGQHYRVRKIQYRTLSTPGVATDNTLRAEVWVAEDGTVLRQEVYLMSVKLRFERCHEPEMIELAERLLDLDSVATMRLPSQTPR